MKEQGKVAHRDDLRTGQGLLNASLSLKEVPIWGDRFQGDHHRKSRGAPTKTPLGGKRKDHKGKEKRKMNWRCGIVLKG